jgi:hypothetical protein
VFSEVFYNHIVASGPSVTYFYGSAEGGSTEYVIINKIEGGERPETLCQDQGEASRSLYQFSAYTGGTTGEAGSAGYTQKFLETVKDYVKTVKGVIGTSEQYRIWNNVTSGVRPLGDTQLQSWGAMFEVELWWEEV